MTTSLWQHRSLLLTSCLTHLLTFCLCWSILLGDQLSTLVTSAVSLAELAMKEEFLAGMVDRSVVVDQARAVVRAVAVTSSTMFSSSLLALASLSIQHPMARWLLAPSILAGWLLASLPSQVLLAGILIHPLPPTLPVVLATMVVLLLLLRTLLLDSFHLTSLARRLDHRGAKDMDTILP